MQVGGSHVEMTDTQAYRFEELQKSRESTNGAGTRGVFDELRYSLEDAAFKLMTTEASLLEKAAAGKLRLFIDAAGMLGNWRSYNADGEPRESTPQSMPSGFLALTVKSCGELVENGRTQVAFVEYVQDVDPEALDIPADVLAVFASWGVGNRFFCFSSPAEIGADQVFLMAPLTQLR